MAKHIDFEPSASNSRLPQVYEGQRIGELCIGADMDEVYSVMKNSGSPSTYEKEHEIFTNYGYIPNEHCQFVLGFDEVWQYSEHNAPDYPVFKIYFKDGLARYIILSSYGTDAYDYDRCKKIKTQRGLAFGDSIEKMEQLYGDKYLKYNFGSYDGDFIYPEFGISFVFEHNEIRNIYLFPANNLEVIEKLKAAYK